MVQPHLLTIVIPAYNEERYIGALIERVWQVDVSPWGLSKQVIVVDDHSTDRTAAIVEAVDGVSLERLPTNGGKGRAVRAGLKRARGDLILIQDADLEYDPDDYRPMLDAILTQSVDAVYGSRYLVRSKHPRQSWLAYLGGRGLNTVARLCTGARLTDTTTALKLFRREALADLDLRSSGFELDHEITAKLVARDRRIAEVPVTYAPRSRGEGKKIGAADWFVGAWTFVRFRRG